MSDLRLLRANRTVHCLGVASALGAPNPGTAEGAETLRANGLIRALRNAGRRAVWRDTLIPPADPNRGEALQRLTARLADEVSAIVHSGGLPLVLGGDHSCAIGTWRGALRGIAGRKHSGLGLVWIDAHLDSHTPYSSVTGRLHGMPLACLLGAGGPPLLHGDEPCLDPRHVCVIGVRSFEPEEMMLLTHLGVRISDIQDIRRRGFSAVLQEALAIARSGSAGFGVTLDLDAIDPHDAPAVGTPVAAGIRAAELVDGLRALQDMDDLVALEIAEFDPHYDQAHKTLRLVENIAVAALAPSAHSLMALEQRYGAHNYEPLPVMLSRGEGAYVWDVDGKRYLDMMSAYSAVSFGHGHPRLVRALTEQAARLGVTSRAFYNDRLPLFLRRLCEVTGYDQALPVNTGLEAVETALKAARKWAYTVKGVPSEKAEIIACEGNFHGRSITIVGFSSEPQYREGFGPFPAGFKLVPYADAAALEAAITPNTAAFLVEPVQGEGGIIVPPRGYLAQCAEICRRHNVLLICDEVQTGLGRTGRLLACNHDNVKPDGVILGKALGGGLLPVSAFVARREVMQVFRPGDHGSTFGGNPLGAAVALEALDVLVEERLCERAQALGDVLLRGLQEIDSPLIREVRGLGLLIGVDIDPERADAQILCQQLLARGLLTKDTHETVLRFAPPLVITREQIDWALQTIREVFASLGPKLRKVA